MSDLCVPSDTATFLLRPLPIRTADPGKGFSR